MAFIYYLKAVYVAKSNILYIVCKILKLDSYENRRKFAQERIRRGWEKNAALAMKKIFLSQTKTTSALTYVVK